MRYQMYIQPQQTTWGGTWAYYYPHTKFHHCSSYRTLDICHFCYQPLRTDANEVFNMPFHWRQTRWVVHVLVPITTRISNFITVANKISGYLIFLLLANQNRYANEVLNMRIWWRQMTWVVLVPTAYHYPHTKFHQCSPYRTLGYLIFLFLAN